MNRLPLRRVSFDIIQKVTVCWAIALCGGCIVYRGDKLSPVTQYPQPASKKSMDVDFSYSVKINGRPQLAGLEKAETEMSGRCVRRLTGSRLFSVVSENVIDPDLKLQIKVEDQGEGSSFMARLSGVTLMLLPCRAKDTYKISAVLVDVKTNRREEINLDESLTLWMHIIFLPVAPFNNLESETNQLLDLCFDNLALEIGKKGLLKQEGHSI